MATPVLLSSFAVSGRDYEIIHNNLFIITDTIRRIAIIMLRLTVIDPIIYIFIDVGHRSEVGEAIEAAAWLVFFSFGLPRAIESKWVDRNDISFR